MLYNRVCRLLCATLVVEESGRALNEVDFPLQSEVGVLEPPLSVRRIDGAVVIGSEEILSPAAIGRRQAVALRRVRFEELDDGLDADAVFRESDLPIDASENGSTSSRMIAATSSSVSVVMTSGCET